jgi:hypothetical protein
LPRSPATSPGEERKMRNVGGMRESVTCVLAHRVTVGITHKGLRGPAAWGASDAYRAGSIGFGELDASCGAG